MNNKILRKVFWFLSFAIMVTLFYSSSRSIEASREDSAAFMEFIGVVESRDEAMEPGGNPAFQLHIAIRKQAHFVAFSTLGVMLFLSLYGYVGKAFKTSVVSWIAATLYGIFDEIHQSFTGRGASVDDVLLNSKSALIGVLVMFIIFLVIESYPKLHSTVNKFYDVGAL